MSAYPLRLKSYRRVSYLPWARYKYELTVDHYDDSGIRGFSARLHGPDGRLYAELFPDGCLRICSGYQWDGCSGPTWDTASTMRAGCIHDCLYQCMRMGLIPVVLRGLADGRFHVVLLEDGCWPPRAWYYYEAVDRFAERHALPAIA